ncbi:MAG: MBL fold metallo-hydrolase [Candidatus Aminicenantes bacterium]|nr:MBL fold metallo-hydrolase [Candidatus Aminicenantes bacterium]NIM83111.1 MBL fold metallo-hydrolase [Candidatus Aminicenantes bacterium]NIN22490.1 MBL fold metallo-hydrolase [Candidatus Aminicenantes bacterium]NIN46258.1 MBL fold metallo-hydrolase [Candidatus Aminicenantes bacterium]NIN89095.1 MBL fold metallo-hydrolase [Candidatus Aminicenantes bacterium]
MIELCSLSSGSNGNAFFIRTGADAFLVDAGISRKQICLRLQQIKSDIQEIKGIFITHEHSDHIRGLEVLMRKFPMPLYITEETYNNSPCFIDEKYLRFITSNDTITIGNTEIQSLPKSHDAADPSLFCFYYKNKKISIVTDIGYACANVQEAVKDADVVFLESNYDEEMLKNGFYPPFLKRRIAGERGHLSNVMAGELVYNHASQQLEYVFLSHLSENNNKPDIAMDTFKTAVKERDDLQHLQEKTLLTSRYGISPMVRMDTEARRLFNI